MWAGGLYPQGAWEEGAKWQINVRNKWGTRDAFSRECRRELRAFQGENRRVQLELGPRAWGNSATSTTPCLREQAARDHTQGTLPGPKKG